jgi:hypothetical protein
MALELRPSMYQVVRSPAQLFPVAARALLEVLASGYPYWSCHHETWVMPL